MSRHKLQASGSRIAAGRLSLAALGCCVVLGLAASSARAASVHVFSSSFGSQGSGAGQVSSPQGVAVNDSTGDIYVADAGNARVDQFDSSGSFVRAWGWGVADGASSFETCTTTCQAGVSGAGAGQFTTPTFIAVDNSGGSSEGDVYVGDSGTNTVSKFSASGGYLSTNNGSAATAPIAGPFGPLAGVTVDSSGSLWVYDQNSNMFEFAPDGTFTEDWNSGRGVIPDGIDADSAGNLYVLTGAGTVEQFSANGTGVGPVNGDVFNPTGFAVDRSDNDVYMDSGGSAIAHYPSSCDAGGSCAAADTFDSGHLNTAAGLAVDSSNGTVYAADAGGSDIAVFTELALPSATTGQASNVASTTATLDGTVDPNGVAVSSCEFEYVDSADYSPSAPDPYSAGSTAPCAQSPGSGASAVPVSADVTGLQPGTIYHFRVLAGNLGGQSAGADQTFDTPGVGFGFQSFSGSAINQDGSLDTQAGSHPYELITTFTMNPTAANGTVSPDQDLKDLHVNLPAGLIGDPQAVPQCDHIDFDGVFAGGEGAVCPVDSEVGILNVQLGFSQSSVQSVPIFNLVPPPGTPAELGGNLAGVRVFLDASVRTGSDYGITINVDNTEQRFIAAAQLTVWGVPADPNHDNQRCDSLSSPGSFTDQATCGASTPFGGAPQPFLTLPTSCGHSLPATVSADSWQNPDSYVSDSLDFLQGVSGAAPDLAGCYKLDFSPSITVQPDTGVADSPSGLSVDVHVPQPDNTNYIYNGQVVKAGINYDSSFAEANLQDATVTLPQGVSVNPSAANGLAACTPAEIGIENANAPSCPDASKIGSVEVDTPLLSVPLTGGIYFAQQTQNPFGSLLAIYLTAYADGVWVKLAGHVIPDPVTGQLTTTFSDNPQLPFTDFKLDFFGGPTGVLATPDQCGTYTTTSSLSPWSGNPAASPSDSFTISSGCVSGFSPSFTAGAQNAQAGAFSPFTLSFERADTDQNLSGLSVTLPPGMLAKLAGVQECSEQQLASISSQPGTGTAQAANPSCPAGSQVGTVETGAGTGSDPFFLPGNVYLTGPYKGAPYGLAVVVPAVAGPLDLGTVVVRQALYIDPTTAQVTAVSDPFPTILDGIPLRIRRIDVDLNRPDFTVNPTSCDPMSVTGTLTSTGGLSSPVSSRFQVGGCQELKFSPKLKMALTGKGKTRSGDHPALVSTLTQPFGQANIHDVKVTLPLSMALDPNNSQHVCNYLTALAVHGGAVGCPASTIVGTASAITPLLSQPLTGNVYLVQGIRFNKQNQPIRTLPSLLIPLRGQIALDLRAKTSVNGAEQLVTTFSTIPDAAVSKFTLTITGGKKGLLVITGRGRTICKKPQVTGATLGAQSGKTENSSIKMSTPCRRTKAHTRSKKHNKYGKKKRKQ